MSTITPEQPATANTQSDAQSSPNGPADARVHTLRSIDLVDLQAMSMRELGDLYRTGIVPADTAGPDLSRLRGTPTSRVLALRGLGASRRLRAVGMRIAASAFFPWGGKRFTTSAAEEDDIVRGYNRLRLAGEHDAARFCVRVAASNLDGAPCVVFDYDIAAARPESADHRAHNTHSTWGAITRLTMLWRAPLRRWREELRQVSPGLFMGPVIVRLGTRTVPIMYLCYDWASRVEPYIAP